MPLRWSLGWALCGNYKHVAPMALGSLFQGGGNVGALVRGRCPRLRWLMPSAWPGRAGEKVGGESRGERLKTTDGGPDRSGSLPEPKEMGLFDDQDSRLKYSCEKPGRERRVEAGGGACQNPPCISMNPV